MSQDTRSFFNKQKNNPLWHDKWFIMDNGTLRGPFTTAEAVKIKAREAGSKNYLISRRGFKKWYPINEVVELHNELQKFGYNEVVFKKEMEANLIHELQSSVAANNEDIDDEFDRYFLKNEAGIKAKKIEVAKKRPKQKQNESFIAKKIGILGRPFGGKRAMKSLTIASDIDNEDLADCSQVSETSQIAPQEDSSSNKLPLAKTKKIKQKTSSLDNKSEKLALKLKEKSEKKLKEKQQKQNETAVNSSHPSKLTQKQFAKKYASLILGLRLGPLKNVYLESIVKFFMTIGFYWPVWYLETLNAVIYHTTGNKPKRSYLTFIKTMIPGYHVWMSYQLATLVSQMEQQNNYQFTKPKNMFFLGVLPFAAIFSLQKAVNHHWVLHAISSDQSRKDS